MPNTRDDAWNLLNEFTTKPNLIKHALAVEAAMRAYAKRFGEDEQLWATVGLVHDFDYERFDTPETHVHEGTKILRDRGWSDQIISAVRAHADYTGEPRDTILKKALWAVDELTGFIVAVALVRPSKSLLDLKAKSVTKKMKESGFAAAVNRDHLRQGAAELGIEFSEHVQFVIDAMKSIAEDLGLVGNVSAQP
jgi:putative nucleotidyltransferase with HDIG domain